MKLQTIALLSLEASRPNPRGIVPRKGIEALAAALLRDGLLPRAKGLSPTIWTLNSRSPGHPGYF